MLQVRRLEKLVNGRSVLYIEQLDIAAGEVVAVIGPVHSGKTSLIRILSGMQAPSGGTVLLNGQDIYQVPTLRAEISTMFTEDLFYERQTAQGNLEFYRQLHKLPKSSVSNALAEVGLSDHAQTPVSKLAPAIQRRLAFARIVMKHAPVCLLDQPILRTDLDTQALFARIISQLAAEGTAVLITGEDLAWAGKCCTRIIELEDGRITNSYSPESNVQPAIPERLIPYKIPARKDDRIMLFDPSDILYATSRDGKTFLRTAKDEATTNLTLQELESRLIGRGFFKAHRAYLVNLQYIKAVIQYTRNSYTLLLNDQQETMVPLSKQCEKELQELLGY
ncbi:MAG TPA: LytTR family transcriptional regulator DNA-binding domain-containing protein [Ktedonobacteraceae bacterium]|nr:LytTR family transcriptional regulator DNA-binding domain-containing protein [Ktedonobacteraceae bacterium]